MFHCWWCGELTVAWPDIFSRLLCPDCQATPEFLAIIEDEWMAVRLLEACGGHPP
jgi:hypothetical protein